MLARNGASQGHRGDGETRPPGKDSGMEVSAADDGTSDMARGEDSSCGTSDGIRSDPM